MFHLWKRLTDANTCIDYIFPRGFGGSDNLDNLRLLCRKMCISISGKVNRRSEYDIEAK